VDVVKDEFLSINFNSDRLMSPINRNVLSEAFMVNVAERIFCTTCKEANLFTRNVLINQELAQGNSTGNTLKNLELCSDRTQLTMKASLDHDVVF
jgi:hypothetical protein